ncbi:hypothetical protein HDK90DRAFT_490544 [Phyllosticta capitalensis]|uniref:Secreted protein n=1 Tax=Phyllosticta capitalensis TaxID=121624 RepID=A0ABR1YHF7_9PEZI
MLWMSWSWLTWTWLWSMPPLRASMPCCTKWQPSGNPQALPQESATSAGPMNRASGASTIQAVRCCAATVASMLRRGNFLYGQGPPKLSHKF